MNDRPDVWIGRWREMAYQERTTLALLLVLGIGVYGVRGLDESLSRDSALYLYAGQRVAEGAPPYVETMNRVGPLMHLLAGFGVAGARLVGTDDVAGARGLFLLISAACVPLAYLLGRAVHPSRLVGLATAAAFLSFAGYGAMATAGPQSKTPMVTFVLLALVATLTRRWTAAGVFTGLVTLTWQPAFVLVAGVGLAAVVLEAPGVRGRLVALGRFVAGGAATLLLTVAYFWLAGALPAFWDGFVLANLQYTEQAGLRGNPELFVSWSWLLLGSGAPLFWLGVAGLLLSGAVSLAALLRRRPLTPLATATLVLAAGLVPALLWSYWVFNGWPDGSMLLPMAAAGVGVVVALARRVLLRTGWPHARTGLAVVVGAATVVTAVATVDRLATYHEDGLHDQRFATVAVVSALPEGSTLMGLESPAPLALAGIENPTRYLLYSDGLVGYLEDKWPGGMQGYADWVADQDVTVLAVRRPRTPPELLEVVDADYVRVGSGRTFGWYLHADQPRELRVELRNRLHVLASLEQARTDERRAWRRQRRGEG